MSLNPLTTFMQIIYAWIQEVTFSGYVIPRSWAKLQNIIYWKTLMRKKGMWAVAAVVEWIEVCHTCTDPPWRSAEVRLVGRRLFGCPPRGASPHAVPRWLPACWNATPRVSLPYTRTDPRWPHRMVALHSHCSFNDIPSTIWIMGNQWIFFTIFSPAHCRLVSD